MQDFSWESIWARIQKESVETMARANVNKDILFDILKKNNVERVFVYFDGSGDNGSIDNVELTPDTTSPLLDEPALNFHWPRYEGAIWAGDNVSIKDAIETICYDYLRAKHQGWENNEGANGYFDFKVKESKILLEFNERSTATYNDEF